MQVVIPSARLHCVSMGPFLEVLCSPFSSIDSSAVAFDFHGTGRRPTLYLVLGLLDVLKQGMVSSIFLILGLMVIL
eukprot:c32221_g1_i1 orf=64-291(+)